ncbi:uncharacterized protein [Littorina saxatilis]|uniref:uncharacterized protein n=1 Tax=Littorina saxatilis TaxID=31220 RepID=UPI0038B4228D
MFSAEDDLQCGLCLNTYKSPKFLPCHHTFCESCVEDMVKNTGNRPLKCPKCRQPFQLPSGGVSKLQTNFYLTPLLNPERCTLHRTENLRFYCTDCKMVICINCRMTDHFMHNARDLGKAMNEVKEKLNDRKGRFSEIETTLSEQMMQVKENIISVGQSREALKHHVERRLEQLSTLARKCADEVVRELEICFDHSQAHLMQDESYVQERMTTVRALQQEVTQGIEGTSCHSLLTLSEDMHTGRGSQQQLDQLTSALPVHTERSVLRYDDNCLQRDVIRKYLGHVGPFQPIPLQHPGTVREVFRCCQDTLLYVHAVCVESCYNDVCVAYGASGTGGGGWVVTHWQGGELSSKSSETIRGRVCLAGLTRGWVRVEGKEFPPKDCITTNFYPADTESAQRKYDVYNKGDARFVLRVHESGLCDLRSVTITDFITITDVKVCEVSAKTPIAMDVSKDGQLVAVLEEGQDHVMLYRNGNTEPYAIYRGHGEVFRPLDVCFYMIGGEERLVIADWRNDVLCVVELGESCKLIGHVGGECPELVKPMALCADNRGCLWIGCQGGRVFKLEYTAFPPIDTRDNSEVVHSEPKRRKTCADTHAF